MKNTSYRRLFLALVFPVILAFTSAAHAAATVTIVNGDPANVGFNDPTVVAPVGGNTGTTLGQQRLIAFQAAANKWGATLTSVVPIRVLATWEALTCTATGAVLGSAGATEVFSNFTGAPFTGVWYGKAETAKLFGSDPDPATADIRARFNINLGNPGCLTGIFFYLGLDGNHGANVDLVTVLTHEFGHGLGFQTYTNASTGAQLSGTPSVWDKFIVDDETGKSWISMTNAERAASSLKTGKLAWNGPNVSGASPGVLAPGTPLLAVTSPSAIAGNYLVGLAAFGPALTAAGTAGNIVQALDPADAAGPTTTDGCSPLTNAAAVAGKLAMIDRGTCGFTVKVKNAQDAGAIGVVIADNVAGSPPAGLGGADATIVIPSVRITLPDANLIKAQLALNVDVPASMKIDNAVLQGADAFGKSLLYAPNPFQSGSSVSHFDVSAFPNQLMEPAINGDLTHEVTPPNDLTFSLLRDIGWEVTTLPSSIAATTGGGQSTGTNQPFSIPITATVSPAVSGITVTWTAVPTAGSFGTFPSTGGKVATSITNASGIATAPQLVANGTLGTFTLNATAPGTGTASFSLNITTVPPGFVKAFSPSTVVFGQPSSLTFTINNSANPVAANSLAFSDTLPAGLVVAPAANASTTCTGGTLTATSGLGTISYTGGSVGAGLSCTVTANVIASAPGSYLNTSGSLTSTLGNSGVAVATLVVNKANTTTTITSDNPDPSLLGQSYTIAVTVAPVAPGAGTPGGTVSVSDGTNSCSITLSSGSGSCSLTGTSVGTKTLTATYAGNGNFNGSAGTAQHQVIYDFTGFSGRVINPPGINYATAGNIVPISFSLAGNQGTNIFAAGSPSSRPVDCSTGTPTGAFAAAASAGLIFSGGQYTYYWSTVAAWHGTCRQFSLGLNDGTNRTLNFQFYF